jgi:hypothetical protein
VPDGREGTVALGPKTTWRGDLAATATATANVDPAAMAASLAAKMSLAG